MKLYSMTISPNGRKVESLVAHLGLDIEVQQVNLFEREQKADAFLAMNPMGKVPVLVDGDFVLWESNAILHYLAGKRPERALVPADMQQRCDMERWMFWQLGHLSSPMARLLNENLIKSKVLRAGDPDAAVVATATEELHKLYPIIEARLAGRDFLCGAASLADFAVGHFADMAPAVGFDDSAYPSVRAWLTRVAALPGWIPMPSAGA